MKTGKQCSVCGKDLDDFDYKFTCIKCANSIKIPRKLLDEIFKEKHPRTRKSLIDFKKLNSERRKNGLPIIGKEARKK